MTGNLRALRNASFTTTKIHPLHTRTLNKRTRRIGIYLVMLIADACAVFAAFMLSNAFLMGHPFASPGLKLAGLVIPIYLAIGLNNKAYGRKALYKSGRATLQGIAALFITFGLILFITLWLSLLKSHHPSFLALGFFLSSVLIAGGRAVCHVAASRLLGENPVNELIIVDDVPHEQAANNNVIYAKDIGLRPDITDPIMLDRLGTLLQSIDRVVVACSREHHNDWALVIRSTGVAGEVHRQYRFAPAIEHADIPIHPSQVKPLTTAQLYLKRAFDLIVVLLVIMFLAPLIMIAAIAIKTESPGPVLFKQKRLGHGNRIFHIYKFRSMRDDLCDVDGDRSTRRDDDRITRVGRFIRATSIDELPQLFNVLNGTMSLVGPRPHALGSKADSQLFWEIDRNYWLRHATMPGLTGLAQVRGFRGATMTKADLENRLASDLEYIQRWSLGFDLLILVRTFGVLVHRNGF